MPELESLGDEMVGAVSNTVAKITKQLASFRTALALFDGAAACCSAWCEGLLYREQGERKLRVWPTTLILQGVLCQGVIWLAQLGSGLPPVGLVTLVLLNWGIGLGVADYLAALQRRRTEAEEGYSYSRFIGWTRFLSPGQDGSYWQQGVLLFLIGANLWTWHADLTGGGFIMVSAVAILVRLWVIRARRREDVMDVLDNEWVSRSLSEQTTASGGADMTETAVTTSRVVSTSVFLRRWSSEP